MILTVHTHPNAKKNELEWVDEDTVKVRIAAPATEGRANRALVEFLAEHFGVSKSRIRLIRGLATRMKQVEIDAQVSKPY